MARADKYIDVAIRGRDEYSRVLKEAEKDLKGFDAARERTNARRNIASENLKGLRETRAELIKARKEATDLGKALYGRGAAPRGFDALSGLENLEAAKARIAELEGALARYNTTLQTLRNKRVGFNAFSQTATALENQVAASRAATSASREQAAAQDHQRKSAERLETQLNRVADASRRSRSTTFLTMEKARAARDRARALNPDGPGPEGGTIMQRISRAWSSQHGRGPLGLRPYELTNLSYQVNDVISGLAMGQAPMQVFAQQAGQIIQIFPNFLSNFMKLARIGAVIAPFAIALSRLNKELALVKEIELNFTLDVDQDDLNPALLANLVKEADRVGLSFDEAKSAVIGFHKAGFSGSQIPDLIDMSQRLARVMGTDVPSAAEMIAKGFGGSVDAVIELDDELNFLTASQYESIRALEKQGRAADAVALGLEAFKNRLAPVSALAEGEWATAMRSLGEAWNSFIDMLSDSSAVEGMSRALNDLGRAVKWVSGLLNSNVLREGGGVVEGLAGITDAELDRRRAGANEYLRYTARRRRYSPGNAVLGAAGYEWSGLKKQNEQAQEMVSLLEAVAAIPEEMRSLENVLQIAQAIQSGGDLQAVLNDITATTENQADAAGDAADETHRSLKNASEIQAVVNKTVAEMDEEARLAALTAKERFIELRVLQQRNELLEKGKKITEEQIAAIRASAAALYDAENPSLNSSESLYEFFKREEGFENKAYKGKDGVWTVGMGVTSAAGTMDVGPNTYLTDAEVRSLFERTVAVFAARVDEGVTVPITEAMRTALISYDYNTGAFLGSNIQKLLNQGDYAGAQEALRNGINTIKGERSEVLVGRRGREADLFGSEGLSNAEIETARGKRDAEAQEARDKFHSDTNAAIALEAEKNARLNEGLIAREEAAALADLEAKAAAAGTEATAEQVAATKENVRQKFAAQAAEEEKNAKLKEGRKLEEAVNLLLERRTFLQSQIDAAIQSGDQSAAVELSEELRSVNTELETAIQRATDFWTAMGGQDAAIQKLQITKAEIADTGKTTEITADSINQLFTDAIGNGFSVFAQAIGEGKSGLQALGAAFRQMASDILIQLGQMIVQQVLFNAISGLFGGNGGLGGKVAGFINAKILHSGGTPGTANRQRSIPTYMAANAPRFHNGTPGNLKSNEIVTILESDEEVLTSRDPRHRKNLIRVGAGGMAEMDQIDPAASGGAGGTGADGRPLTIINQFDSGDVVSAGMNTSAGGEAFLNMVRRNRDVIKAELG